MISPFSIENMKEELARALNQIEAKDKEITDLKRACGIYTQILATLPARWEKKYTLLADEAYKLTNKPNKIDFPILLQDEAE
jgi:hypothetical protein